MSPIRPSRLPPSATALPIANYPALLTGIGSILSISRQQAYTAVNSALVQAYWKIGQRIVEFEQGGKEKAEYGSELLDRLQRDLTLRYGRGFSRSNIIYIRLLYLKYPTGETLSHQLTWSHYFELLKVEDNLERLHPIHTPFPISETLSRKFRYPIFQTQSGKLSGSHRCSTLMAVSELSSRKRLT